MSETLLFATGFVVFIFVTTAILMFGYARFNQLYATDRDQAAGDGIPVVRRQGNLEVYVPEEATG